MNTRALEEIKYEGFLDWFVKYTPPEPLWLNQPTYLVVQASFLFGGLLTWVHGIRGGGRLRWLWLAAVLHGLAVECICFILPNVDNYWHSQTPLMFVGRRLPLHIITLYPFFIYQASVAASQLKLPKWSEPFAVGLLVVLIDIPYDIVSVKFVHWTWHDTDPNIADRHYWVPWNSYYFHLTFAASFTFWFHAVRRWIDCRTAKWQSARFSVELVSAVMAAVLGPLGGIALFVPLYHPLHDLYHIHSEVTFFILFTFSLLIVWTGQRASTEKPTDIKLRWKWLLLLALAVHYSVFLGMVCLSHPEKEVSLGVHEPIGPCGVTKPFHTVFGVLKKNEYLCPTKYDEGYFDFHCAPGGIPKGRAKWYTICGTPFQNRAEYITIISTLSALALGVFTNIYFYTHQQLQVVVNKKKQ